MAPPLPYVSTEPEVMDLSLKSGSYSGKENDMEFEFEEEMADAAIEGAEGAADLAMSEGAEVEENAAIDEMAEAPEAVAENSNRIKDFVTNNPFGKVMWALAKTTASAAVAFGIFYGLNKALAGSSHESGKRTALSEYLKGVADNFAKNGLEFTAEMRQTAATDALAFPWIDATA